MNFRVALVLLVAAVAAPAQLPITRVILYKSGVGYFQRSGTISPGTTPKLTFRSSEMNDVLQSLTVTDASGGAVRDVRYQADEPLARDLSLFPFHLEASAPLASFLAQVRGARVTVVEAGGNLTGTVVGARAATVPTAAGVAHRQQLTLLLDSGDIRTVNLDQTQGLRLLDPDLQKQFRHYLSRLATSRGDMRRSLSLELTGNAPQQIEVHYIQAEPVWKSSWRLAFRPGKPPLLEGWAIVNNTGSDDWRNVSLELVSGRPVSFISPLYPPEFLHRPTIQTPEEAALRPYTVLNEMAPPEPTEEVGPGSPGGVLGGVLGGLPAAAPPPPPPPPLESVQVSSLRPHVVTHPRGTLFSYALSHPVTIDRGQAAMVPILQQPVKAAHVLIYSPETGSHPRAGLRLTNNTGDTLDGGPLLVYDHGAYAGEGLMATMPNSDERLIDYASAPEVTIRQRSHYSAIPQQDLHAKGGFLYFEMGAVRRTTYAIDDIGPAASLLVLEHPSNFGNLVSPAATRVTQDYEEFDLHLQPHAKRDFTVVERQPIIDHTALGSVDAKTIEGVLENKTLSAEGRRQLGSFMALLHAREQVEAEIAATGSDLNDLARNQARLRKDIASLNHVAGEQHQMDAWAAELVSQESRFQQLQEKLAALRQKSLDQKAGITAAATAMKF